MPITPQHSQELLSVAYAYAVAARAGMNVTHDFFDYGVDLTFSYVQETVNGKRRPTSYDLKFQLKASINTELEDDNLIFDLEVETFNTLCTWPGYAPCYLLVMRQPREFERHVEVSEDFMTLRDCCYWHRIPLGPESPNEYKQRIRIPRRNQFTPEALVALMDEFRYAVHA